MKKLALLLATLMFTGFSAYAKAAAPTLPAFDVTFNDVAVESEYRQFPLLVYKDITYVPMTYYDCRYLGLATRWDNETSTLFIDKYNFSGAYRDYAWEWKNPKTCDADICSFNIVVNGKEIDNSAEEYPLLLSRDVTYFPLTWRFAVEEFGWEYSFDEKTGLSIKSDNLPGRPLDLPNISGSAATDGEYYYYNGTMGEKNVVYRAPVSDTKNASVIFELPDTFLSQKVGFVKSGKDVYFTYLAGSSPIMGTSYSYKIEPDGTVTENTPETYSLGKHGYSEAMTSGDGISVKAVNMYVDSSTAFSFEKDGKTVDAIEPDGRVRIGRRRNGLLVEVSAAECIKVFDGKIYYTGSDLDAGTDSALYCIDTETGETKKLIDGVCGFHVYSGWLNEEEATTTMILYDDNGHLMRYIELTGETQPVEANGGEDGLVLKNAIGGIDLYTVQQTIGGGRTVVKMFACYGEESASINGVVLMDTNVGVYVNKYGDKLCICQAGETSAEDVRTIVLGEGVEFYSSDVASGVFIYEDILLYQIGEKVVRVDLKK